jgi:hypothetical protein
VLLPREQILAEPAPAPAIPIAELEQAIAALSADERERLAHHFRSSSIRRRRIDERDRLIRELAGEILPAGARSGRELAEAVAAALRRYAALAWRIDRERAAPGSPRHARLYGILRLGRGSCPGKAQCRRMIRRLVNTPGNAPVAMITRPPAGAHSTPAGVSGISL